MRKYRSELIKRIFFLLEIIVIGAILFSLPDVRGQDVKITLSPFVIDDLGIDGYTWEEISLQEWCKGNGTKWNPYIIENIEIEHTDHDYFDRGLSDCLEIKNSEVYFIIKNCSFHGAGRLPVKQEDGSWLIGYGGEGLSIYNCSNGLIMDNYCYDNIQSSGIELSLTRDFEVVNNTCFNNHGGVYIDFMSENVTVLDNTIRTNSLSGISLSKSDYIRIVNNNIIADYQHYFLSGITTSESDHNILDGNLIDHAKTGIGLEVSDYNNITNNIIHYYQYDIVEIGRTPPPDYCEGNIFDNNTCIFDDFMPPSISIAIPQENSIYNRTAPSFNVYIVERLSTGIDSQWYTVDNGITNHTFTLSNFDTGNDSYGEYIAAYGIGVIDQEVWNRLGNGNIAIRFYANDTLGHIAYSEVIVIKNFSPPVIIGYDIYISIGMISVILLVMKRRLKNELNP
jgi:parallel beta-helix repeat protein